MKAEGTVKIVRYLIRISGLVQGVGFRYHILKLAEQHRVSGHVANGDKELFIEVEGIESAIDMFLRSIRLDVPAGAKIRAIGVETIALKGDRGFRIKNDVD